MLDTAVNILGSGDIDALVGALTDLATRHVGYGAKPAHYGVVGKYNTIYRYIYKKTIIFFFACLKFFFFKKESFNSNISIFFYKGFIIYLSFTDNVLQSVCVCSSFLVF